MRTRSDANSGLPYPSGARVNVPAGTGPSIEIIGGCLFTKTLITELWLGIGWEHTAVGRGERRRHPKGGVVVRPRPPSLGLSQPQATSCSPSPTGAPVRQAWGPRESASGQRAGGAGGSGPGRANKTYAQQKHLTQVGRDNGPCANQAPGSQGTVLKKN